jgi:type I restriction enzyme S subunit
MKPVLSEHWRWVSLGMILNRQRDLVNPSDYPDREFNSIGLEDIGGNGTGEVAVHAVPGAELASSKAQFVTDDLLYGRLRPYLNKVAIAPCEGVSSTEIWVLQPTPVIDTHFAFWMLTSHYLLKQVERVTEGANLPRVDADGFDRIDIPVPPLSEQRRIVEILNEARDIVRLRQHADDLTTQLIPAIFNDMFDNLDRSAYVPLSRLFARSPQNGLYKPAESYGAGTRIVRIGDFYNGKIVDIEALQRLSLTAKEMKLYALAPNDILLNRVNSIEYLGKSAIVPQINEPAVFESNMMRFSVDAARLLPEFLIAYLQTPLALHELRRRAKHAINQASVNQGDVGALPVPAPTLDLQVQFIACATAAHEIAYTSLSAAASAGDLQQSLLAYAFSGELTADWRDAHQEKLAQEATERDTWLRQNGVKPTTLEHRISVSTEQTDGRHAELNREQRKLLEQVEKLDRNENGGTFTLSSLIPLEEPLNKLPVDAVRRHIDVLTARGLIKAVSRRAGAGGSVDVGFGNVYRLPLRDEDIAGTADGPDYRRLSELDRFSKQGRVISRSVSDELAISDSVEVSVERVKGDD